MGFTGGCGRRGSIPSTNLVTLAQLVERLTFNQVDEGSIPSCDKLPLFKKASASGECVGVTLSNYSPVAP